MNYQAELNFFKAIFENQRMNIQLVQADSENLEAIDLSLRRILGLSEDYDRMCFYMESRILPNRIYHVTDQFFCSYYFLLLPDTEPATYLSIGPYLTHELSDTTLMEYVEKYKLPPQHFSNLQNFFQSLPVGTNYTMLTTLLHTFAERIWGSTEHFTFETLEYGISATSFASFDNTLPIQDQPSNMELLEMRYTKENELLQAVSQGLSHKAEALWASFSSISLEPRTSDALRNSKNYMIIFNTLLRKAAELGSVHPYYIDKLSSDFARKIEYCTSEKACVHLQHEMIRKYSLLVKNHSMKGYSLLVRKVITLVDSDLSADLTLSEIAKFLNVNPSYLSNLFKKETGSTLTEYVNRKRIEYAILLLNSTSLQIQTIAQYCGIPDVNYFTKIFKKYISKTPKDYRKAIRGNEH